MFRIFSIYSLRGKAELNVPKKGDKGRRDKEKKKRENILYTHIHRHTHIMAELGRLVGWYLGLGERLLQYTHTLDLATSYCMWYPCNLEGGGVGFITPEMGEKKSYKVIL